MKSSELRDGPVRRTEEAISDIGLENSAAKLIPGGAVLVAMYGATAGRVGYLKIEAAINQAVCALIPDTRKTDPTFLFHALRAGYGDLVSKTAGAAQQNLNVGTVKSFTIPAPEVQVQRRVGVMLGAFDELIEINEQRIAALRKLARAIYRNWFARRGSETLDGAVEGAMGSDYGTWTECRLGDVIEVNRRTLKATELPEPIEYIDISSVGMGRIHPPKVIPTSEAPGRARRRVADGDVVWSTVRPNRRAYGLVHDPSEQMVASTGLAVLTPTRIPSCFLFEFCASATFTDYLIGRATGSAYPAVRPLDFLDAPMVVPPQRLLDRYAEVADPLLREASALEALSLRYGAARDLLLPRLVTGKLDISDIDLGILTPAELE